LRQGVGRWELDRAGPAGRANLRWHWPPPVRAASNWSPVTLHPVALRNDGDISQAAHRRAGIDTQVFCWLCQAGIPLSPRRLTSSSQAAVGLLAAEPATAAKASMASRLVSTEQLQQPSPINAPAVSALISLTRCCACCRGNPFSGDRQFTTPVPGPVPGLACSPQLPNGTEAVGEVGGHSLPEDPHYTKNGAG